MDTTQYQALGTKRFQNNQALFKIYTAVDGALKKKIVTTVQPVFLYPLVDQLKGFGKGTVIQTIQRLFKSYMVMDRIELEENAVN